MGENANQCQRTGGEIGAAHKGKESEKELAEKEAQNQELIEKINRTSKNSSSPPSADPLNAEKPRKKNTPAPSLLPEVEVNGEHLINAV